MIDTIEKPKNCAEFQQILKPILGKHAVQAACKNSKRRAKLAQETINALEDLFQYAARKEKASQDLKVETGRLRAQVQALQGVLEPKSRVIVAHQKPDAVQGEMKEGES